MTKPEVIKASGMLIEREEIKAIELIEFESTLGLWGIWINYAGRGKPNFFITFKEVTRFVEGR